MRYVMILSFLLLVFFRIVLYKIPYNNGDRVRITTRVLTEPVKYSKNQSLSILKLKIYLPSYPEISYGDEIIVEGVVKDGKLLNPKLISLKEKSGLLFKFRSKIVNFYRSILPEPHASLVAGITLGSKSQMSESFWQKLKLSGLLHVVVASGTNITFVAGFLISVLSLYLTRRKSLIFAILGIWVYAFLSGLEAPIIRATVMTTILFLAQTLGRVTFSWNTLLITASLMLLYNPLWINDFGFILSFVSTASIMLFQTRINKLKVLNHIPSILKEGISTSVAAQIGVAPIIFASFGQFNPLSVIANALVLWTIPGIMVIGGIGGFLGLISPFLGRLTLYLGYPLTWWFIKIVSIF